ncbi:GerAB/ArcD/ProY family transporter [Clostridium sp. BJN0013]|uniref:GerAB/ArcD/ProY family transporter n=1 Tax=Clostridium sp. BJN0013 TaxID=3236840 RepID=UPI0034C66A74
MLENSDGKIGTRECIALIIIMIFEKITNSTSSAFFKTAENAGWIIPIFSAITLIIPILSILCLLKRYKNKGLVEIVYYLTGNYIGFLISYILLIVNIIIISTNLVDDCNVINTLFFPNTDIYYLIITLIGFCCFMAILGLKALARASYMLMPYIIGIFISLILFAMPLITTQFLFPIAGKGVKHIIMGGIYNSFIYQVIIILSVCYPMFGSYKNFKTASLTSLTVSAFILSISFAFFQMTFDYPAITITSYPLHTLTRIFHLTRFISNLQAIFLPWAIVVIAIYYSTALYLASAIFAYALKLEKIEPLIIPISALIAIISIIPENSRNFSRFFNDRVVPIITIISIVVPLLLLVISQWKGDYKKC